MGTDLTAPESNAPAIMHQNGTYAVAGAVEAKLKQLEVAVRLAIARPRHSVAVVEQLVALCSIPEFSQEALYEKERGGKSLIDLGVRFIEEALRSWGNVWIDTEILQDGDDKRVGKLEVWDLEAGTRYSEEVIIAKTVERNSAAPQETLYTRTGARGQTVYIVRADEQLVRELWAKACSFALRNIGGRILPADLKAKCRAAALAAYPGKKTEEQRGRRPTGQDRRPPPQQQRQQQQRDHAPRITEAQRLQLWNVGRNALRDDAEVTAALKLLLKKHGYQTDKDISTDDLPKFIEELERLGGSGEIADDGQETNGVPH